MLEKIKLLLGLTDDTQDDLISLLIEMAQEEFLNFCHLSDYSVEYNSIVMKMVIQNYNKIGNEGFNSSSIGGVMTESYVNGYSDELLTAMKRYRKLVTR